MCSTILTQSRRAQSEYAAGAITKQKSGVTVKSYTWCGVRTPAIVTRSNATFSLSMSCFIARVLHNLDAELTCSVAMCSGSDEVGLATRSVSGTCINGQSATVRSKSLYYCALGMDKHTQLKVQSDVRAQP